MSRRKNNHPPCLYRYTYECDDWPVYDDCPIYDQEEEVTDGFFSRKCEKPKPKCEPPKKSDKKCAETKPQAGCKPEKKDPCKPEKKDPCKPVKKDPCKLVKKDPCKAVKKDPCKPVKKDPCAISKKPKRDPCPRKPNPCKVEKKPDPCKPKRDPCPRRPACPKKPACNISNDRKKARKAGGKNPRSRNPFIIFFLMMYYKCPSRKVTDVAREAGKVWCRMPEPRKEVYKRLARIEQKKLRRKQKGCRKRKRC